MANIDLIVNFQHPAAVSNTIRYARIDNTVTPVYVTIPGILPGQDPYTIAGVPNGQYRVGIKPVYSDGRACAELFLETPACMGINSFSAVYDGTDINVTYSAAGTLPAVRVNVSYPNGGSSSQIFTNGDAISITPPPFVSGTFYVTMQPVCDEDTGFFGVSTAPVVVNIILDQTVLIANVNPNGGTNNLITNVTGISGFVFGTSLNEGETRTGVHSAFTGPISVTIRQLFTIGPTYNGLSLSVNGSVVECINTPGSTPFGQTFNFASATYATSDVIEILYDFNICGTSPGGNNFFLTNGTAAGVIDSFHPGSVATITDGSTPVAAGDDAGGEHTGFNSSVLSIDITGTIPDGNIILYKNNIPQECVAVSGAGSYTFSTLVSFGVGDLCEISLNDGPCP